MANFTTAADLLDAALFSAGEPTDGTSDFDSRALTLLNRSYRAIWNGGNEFAPEINEDWWWLRKSTPGVLTLEPAITSLTASVTNNSASVTLSSSPTLLISSNLSDWYFKVDDHGDVFQVSSHTGTSVTLDSVYTGTTNSAANITLYRVEYALETDALKVLGPMRCYQKGRREINGVEVSALDRNWPLSQITSGVPHEFAVIAEDTDGDFRVRFSHYGGNGDDTTELIRVEYDYLQVPSDLTDSSGSIPLVPAQYRYILADMTAAFLAADKDDDRAAGYSQAAASGLRAMAIENKRRSQILGRETGKIFPRQNELPQFDRPLRTEGGVIL